MRTPMMRVGEPMEMAQSISFLLSKESMFITGVDLKVDGGFTLMDGAEGHTAWNRKVDIMDPWKRWAFNADFDLESKSIREKEPECTDE